MTNTKIPRATTNLLRIDPTRLASLRRSFVASIKHYYQLVKIAIRYLVDKLDIFGLKQIPSLLGINKATDEIDRETTQQAWRFDTSEGKVKRFRAWLRKQMDTALKGNVLVQYFIDDSYRKGVERSYDDINRKAKSQATTKDAETFLSGGRHSFLRSLNDQPTVEKVKHLASLTFSELEDVNNRMATKMSRILAVGLARRSSPADIAKEMVEQVDIELPRAVSIVNTELTRVHAEGQLDSMDKQGVSEVGVAAEWTTRGDGKVCPKCKAMEGKVFAISDARGLIPIHPHCRCIWQATSFR